jgi:hypothetical protein
MAAPFVHLAGESKSDALRLVFDRRIKLHFHGAKLSSDGGLLLFRELDAALGLTEMAAWELRDRRTGRNTQHTLLALFRQSVFGRLAGYEDVNDADRLSRDPVMRSIVGRGADHLAAASESEMGRFETGVLSDEQNLAALTGLNGEWIDRVQARRRSPTLILDIDSSESPVHGDQEAAAYNGYFGCVCYHPIFVFNQFGDLERCALRPGNVASADGWRDVLAPVIERYRWQPLWRRYLRADAAFARPDIYTYLEQERFGYAIRLPANPVLGEKIGHLLTRRPGRPSVSVERYFASFTYRAESWDTGRRVVAKVEWHPGELLPHLSVPAERVFDFYNRRGTAEQWIKEGKYAIRWTRLSCRSFAANAVRLQLHALAYNLGNFLRTLALPPEIAHWSLTSLRERLIKIGAKLVLHARSITFQLAEVAVPRRSWEAMLAAIAGLRPVVHPP